MLIPLKNISIITLCAKLHGSITSKYFQFNNSRHENRACGHKVTQLSNQTVEREWTVAKKKMQHGEALFIVPAALTTARCSKSAAQQQHEQPR